MTTDRDTRVPPELRQWSAELLEVPTDATFEQVRVAIARKLAAWDFAPPDRWQHAAELMACPPQTDEGVLPAVRERPLAEVEHRLRQQVEDFAARFFTHAPGDRSRAWHALRLRCAQFPLLLDRLEWLERGLAAMPAAVESEPQQPGVNPQRPTAQLARELAELFVLSAAERAVRRFERVEAKWNGLVQWERAVRRLQAEHPQVAALDEDFLDRILTLRDHAKQREKLAKANRKQHAKAVPKSEGGMLEGNAWKYVLAFWIILGIVRAIGNSPSTPPRPPAVNYRQPPSRTEVDETIQQLLRMSTNGDTQVEYRGGRFVIIRRRAAPTTPDAAESILDGAADVSLPPLPRVSEQEP